MDIPKKSPAEEVCAVLLAGGRGTRIRHLLDGIPKPMVAVAGRPFVEHVVRYYAGFGIRCAVISSGYRAGVIAQHFAQAELPGICVRCVSEDHPMGTAGGFVYAAQQSALQPDVWLVANGDSMVICDIGAYLADFARGGWDAALLGLRVLDTARYGRLAVNPDRQLVRFAEKQPGQGLINAGVYLFRPRALAAFPAGEPLSFETEVFPRLLGRGLRILVHEVDAPFLDIGTPETLVQAELFIRTHFAPGGVGVVEPKR